VRVLPLLLVAASVGLGNLAAAIGIGFGGVSMATRLRVALVFGAFETGMPLVGLVIGAGVATGIGEVARWIGAGLLIAVGGGTLLRALRQPAWPGAGGTTGHPVHSMGLGKLIVTAFALSLDNLAAGFALGTLHVSVAEAAIVIGAVSVLMSLAGLEAGGRLGASAGRRGEQIGGAILVAVGVALAAGVI
jgi:putative Mn2+ efflux pump MntP